MSWISSLFYLQDPAKLAATKPAVASEGTGPGRAEPPQAVAGHEG